MSTFSIKGLSAEELEYYSRQIVLDEIGVEGQKKLKLARICVVGVGGLGSPVSIQLASIGVGHIRIIDRDVVEVSNLQRQHIYGMDKIGYPKVEAAAERLKTLNPFIEIEPIPMTLMPGNAERLIESSDLVVDCLDSMSSRYSLNRACVKLGIPLIHGAVITHIGNATTIIPGETACLKCFKGNLDDDALPTCALVGVHPSIISLVASIQVSEAVKIILGESPNLANKLIFCDLEDLSFEKIELSRVNTCSICGRNPREEPSALSHDTVQEICGREGRRVFVFSPKEDLELSLASLNKRLRGAGYELTVEALLGTTFNRDSVKGSVLKSGVIILEGVEDITEANKLHDSILRH